jgi:hypothetical protein
VAAAGHQCLLCGGQAHAVQGDGEVLIWDLCQRCNAVFVATAARVAATVVLTVAGARAEAVVQLAGQLELDDEAQA